MSRHKVSTNRKTKYSLSRSKVDVLRLDKDFFHKNSALPLPVKLPDSNEKAKVDKAALDILGIKSLAVVFKHLEKDERLHLVLVGHADGTDDKGGVPERFALSRLRANAMYALLAGKKDEWAAAVYAKHMVRDYKLLLKYFHLNKKQYFGKSGEKVKYLDPGDIDDSWNDTTDKATRNFIVGFNEYAKASKIDTVKLSNVMKEIKDDGDKRWPVAMWKAVFVLYENAMTGMLGLKTEKQLKEKRKKILKFCDGSKPYVSCGESFPLKDLGDKAKSGYDPDPFRGVEIFFFDRKQLPGKSISKKMRIICPADESSVHKAEQCPIFYKYHIKASYIDHTAYDVVTYYVKFVYYDHVIGDIKPVPDGMTLEMAQWDSTKRKKTIIKGTQEFKEGIYSVTIPDDKNRKNLSIWFRGIDKSDKSKRLWIFTKDKDTAPELVGKKDSEIAKLTPSEREKYYDLPERWCSLNYWTRWEKYSTGDDYEKLMKSKKIKPYGSEKMTASKPLIFCLDDIVLVDKNGNQAIRDKDESGSAKDLSAHSRVTLLYADGKDKFNIKIHKPKAKEVYFSDVKGGFEKNLIHDSLHDKNDKIHRPCRAVVFCSDFYDVYHGRTEKKSAFRFESGHILGARAAKIDDADCSRKGSFSGWDADDKKNAYVCDGAGNYRLHYLHDWGIFEGKVHSGLILYWNCRFEVSVAEGGTDADKTNYIEKGMKNAMDRNGLKKYQMEKLTGTEDVIIKTFPFFEAKQDYKVGAASVKRGGGQICTVNLRDDSKQSNMGFDSANFRSSAYKDEPDRHAVGDPNNNKTDYDGLKYNSLTCAHEIGHACGLDDEYIRTADSHVGLAQYSQYYPGVPYSCDLLTLMSKNRGMRMHHFWLYANWINDQSKKKKGLKKFLGGSQYKITLRGSGFTDLEFELTDKKYRNIYKPAWEGDVDFGNGAHGQLIVYKLGDGEFANTLKTGKKFTGIMVIRTNIQVSFANDTQNWVGTERADWTQALDSDLKIMLGNPAKYCLTCDTAGHDFGNVFMYFLPHYTRDNPAPAGTHFKIKVKKNGGSGFTADATDKTKITVGNNIPGNKTIIRYLFGKTGTTNLTKPELGKIKDWMGHKDRGNDTFKIEDV